MYYVSQFIFWIFQFFEARNSVEVSEKVMSNCQTTRANYNMPIDILICMSMPLKINQSLDKFHEYWYFLCPK